MRQHLDREERRLAYVAVTRARHALLLTGSFWATQANARKPSPYLIELEAAGIIAPLPRAPAGEENPLGDEYERVTWPFDPLGKRRAAVEAAAEAVRAAAPALDGPWRRDLELLLEERRLRMSADGAVEAAAEAVRAASPSLEGPWRRELELLLEERRRRLSAGATVTMPVRVPASRFKDYVNDPASVAASLRRPMPERPFRATQLGTLFHSWVENRYGVGGDSEELDALPTETDAEDYVDDEALAALKTTFESSPWASRKPVDVEREIHLPFDGRIVICKIDAVYSLDDDRFEIVDWKTGKAPRDENDLEQKQLQLALYRLAYARWRGIDPARIDAVFYYVSDDRVIRPDHIYGEAELLEAWRRATAPADS